MDLMQKGMASVALRTMKRDICKGDPAKVVLIRCFVGGTPSQNLAGHLIKIIL